MKFTVITACKNSCSLLKETIDSVLNQTIFKNKLAELEYIIFDCISEDNSHQLLQNYAKKNKCITYIREKDSGLYHALTKGFKIASGDYCSYINAGDFYNLNAFEIIYKVFTNYQNIKWVTGIKCLYNDNSEIINLNYPYIYRKSLISAGVYGKYLPFIQQESVFWKKELLKLIDFKKFKNFKLAGDYYLWYCFSKKEKLFVIQSQLSGFKLHLNQLSSKKFNNISYRDEVASFSKKITLSNILLIIIDVIPWAVLKYSHTFFGKFSNQITYSNLSNKWLPIKNSEIYVWACDISLNRGEGKLGNEFIQRKLKNNFNNIFIRNNLKFFNYNYNFKYIDNRINLSFFESYISPFLGIIYLWFKYLQGKKICYLNFFPLWNIFLFVLLPPSTIFGPITGSHYQEKIISIKSFLRKLVIPQLYKLSKKILKYRSGEIYFSTNLLKYLFNKKEIQRYEFSYIFKNLKSKKIYKKTIDFFMYFRKYDTKSNTLLENLARSLSAEKNIKFFYCGHLINDLKDNYLGYIDNKEIIKILEKTKYSISTSENIESYFTKECLENNVKIFADIKNRKYLMKNNFIFIKFNDYFNTINRIINTIKN